MSEHYLSVYGTRYFASEPLYCSTANGMVFDRVKRRWLEGQALLAKVADESHTWQPREVGIPSLLWQLANTHHIGQDFAPPWDDTSGTASEAVTNGEDWTGATGTTPPTGWTTTGDGVFTINAGNIEMTSAVLGATMEQTLTVTPGGVYVLEMSVDHLTTDGAAVSVDGVKLPIGPGPADGDPAMIKCLSFTANDADVDITFTIRGGGAMALKFVRCYLESELTGSG